MKSKFQPNNLIWQKIENTFFLGSTRFWVQTGQRALRIQKWVQPCCGLTSKKGSNLGSKIEKTFVTFISNKSLCWDEFDFRTINYHLMCQKQLSTLSERLIYHLETRFDSSCMPTRSYGNTGCRVFKQGVQN